jgi:hypothetical protein
MTTFNSDAYASAMDEKKNFRAKIRKSLVEFDL